VLSSREGAHPPVLVVDAERLNAPAPAALRGRRSGKTLVFDGVGARLDLRYGPAPVTDFDSAQAYPRWRIDPLAPKPHPLATSNSLSATASVQLDDLKPGAYHFAARTVNAAGAAGPVVKLGPVRLDAPVTRGLPPVPAARPPDSPGPVWAVAGTLKIKPSGTMLEPNSPVWRGSVPLSGARNEFIAFQLAVEGAHQGVSVEVSRPLFASSRLLHPRRQGSRLVPSGSPDPAHKAL
jgi:hypothetical protein